MVDMVEVRIMGVLSGLVEVSINKNIPMICVLDLYNRFGRFC